VRFPAVFVSLFGVQRWLAGHIAFARSLLWQSVSLGLGILKSLRVCNHPRATYYMWLWNLCTFHLDVIYWQTDRQTDRQLFYEHVYWQYVQKKVKQKRTRTNSVKIEHFLTDFTTSQNLPYTRSQVDILSVLVVLEILSKIIHKWLHGFPGMLLYCLQINEKLNSALNDRPSWPVIKCVSHSVSQCN